MDLLAAKAGSVVPKDTMGSYFTPGTDVSALGHRDLCYGIKRN